MKKTFGLFAAAAVALAVTGLVGAPGMEHSSAPAPLRAQFGKGEFYPYQSGAFTQFVAASYQVAQSGQASDFYAWMDRACVRGSFCSGAQARTLAQMDDKRTELDAITDRAQRAQAELALAASLHHWIKTSIPTFSLEEGFEFANVARHGERQCLLQSVLLAALLQEADVNAGVVMVYKNDNGHVSNNGHCVTLLKLSDGTDVLVDASDRQPFVRHQGLFAKDSVLKDYRYVEPVFKPNSPIIVSYQSAAHDEKIATRPVRPLDTDFLHSQFHYYRGERAHGGLLTLGAATRTGLTEEADFLRASVHACPQNPLPVYMLGRVEWRRGHEREARRQLERAARLYDRAGWLPGGLRDAQREAHIKTAEAATTDAHSRQPSG